MIVVSSSVMIAGPAAIVLATCRSQNDVGGHEICDGRVEQFAISAGLGSAVPGFFSDACDGFGRGCCIDGPDGDFDIHARDRAAEQLGVIFDKARFEHGAVWVHRLVFGQSDRDFPTLAGIAHVDLKLGAGSG